MVKLPLGSSFTAPAHGVACLLKPSLRKLKLLTVILLGINRVRVIDCYSDTSPTFYRLLSASDSIDF